MRFQPYVNKAASLVRGRKELPEMADSVETVAPEEKGHCPATIYLEDQLQNIIAPAPRGRLEDQFARMKAHPVVHRPVLRYELRDCLVYPNGVCVKGANLQQFGPLQHRLLLTRPIRELDRAFFSIDRAAMQYFGHWLTDACTTALLKREDEALILPTRDSWPDTRFYCGLFDFEPEAGELFYVRRLSFCEDIAHGSSKHARFSELRRRARRRFSGGKAKKIYIRRGRTGAERVLHNDDDITALLEREGFLVLSVEEQGAQGMLSAGMDADIVVSMEGSHQAHAMLMLKDNGVMLTIQPPDRFNHVFRAVTLGAGLRYATVVAVWSEEDKTRRLDPDSLLRTIELCEKTETAPA